MARSSVTPSAFWPAAAARIASRVPCVADRPPTPAQARQSQTVRWETPNQYTNAAALSVRMARSSSGLTHTPAPPRCPSGWHRGHEMRAAVRPTTRHHLPRYAHHTRRPTRVGGGVYEPNSGGIDGIASTGRTGPPKLIAK